MPISYRPRQDTAPRTERNVRGKATDEVMVRAQTSEGGPSFVVGGDPAPVVGETLMVAAEGTYSARGELASLALLEETRLS
ncbi:hypothetical protein U1Q18_046903, partial [Sarracenia purpurea var. burkii]